ncbi:MaoC family dehydratase [Streptomyces sp. RS2]|uniref:MaoC family dehydratase n=1 Tax=Streptomyces sp. RS2 TaxID=1451205 RepID=UPI0021F90FCE|nr:MaoC family dehydratase [Streptomyces sp. RS2]MCW1100204.1 MaoC family dehydratase [Streptomyces sp. RS2]
MRIFHGIVDLATAVGDHLGHSKWHTITQEQIDQFADATGDHQWIHVDTAQAQQGPFGSTIAHGYLTLSMLPMLVWEVYRIEGVEMTVNYGVNKVRFPAPVPVGSRIRAGVELVSLDRNDAHAQAVVRVTVERHGHDKPVCVAETLSRLAL